MEKGLALVILLFGLGLVCALILGIYDKVSDGIAKRRHKKHPQLYIMLTDLGALKLEKSDLLYEMDSLPRQKIDKILKEYRYYTKAQREEAKTTLENLRNTIAEYPTAVRSLNKKIVEMERKIETYIAKNNIKWY